MFKSFNIDDTMSKMANYSANIQVEPESFRDIRYKPDKNEWLNAINDELKKYERFKSVRNS